MCPRIIIIIELELDEEDVDEDELDEEDDEDIDEDSEDNVATLAAFAELDFRYFFDDSMASLLLVFLVSFKTKFSS